MIAVVFLLAGSPVGAQAIAVFQARGARFQQDVVVDGRGERQARGQVLVVGLAVAIGQFQVVVGLAVQVSAPHLQPQQVLFQRPAQVKTGLPGVTLVTVLTQRVVIADRPAPLRRHLAGDDVDHPADGIGTIQ
ncbi:hypothetical protein D3C80_1023110 [compost metagenome]